MMSGESDGARTNTLTERKRGEGRCLASAAAIPNSLIEQQPGQDGEELYALHSNARSQIVAAVILS